MSRHLSLLALAGGLLTAAAPAHGADAAAGHALARLWCAQCHVVDADQKRASDAAPPFDQIANDPLISPSGIAVWLIAPHPPMPKLDLTHDQINDLVAYIETLKTD